MIITWTRGAEDNIIWLQLAHRAPLAMWQAIADGVKHMQSDPAVERAETFGSKSSLRFFLAFHEPADRATVERIATNLQAFIDDRYHPRSAVSMDVNDIGEPSDDGPRRRTPVWSVDVDLAARQAQPSGTRRQRKRKPVSAAVVDALDLSIARGEINYKQAWDALKAGLNGGDESEGDSVESTTVDQAEGPT